MTEAQYVFEFVLNQSFTWYLIGSRRPLPTGQNSERNRPFLFKTHSTPAEQRDAWEAVSFGVAAASLRRGGVSVGAESGRKQKFKATAHAARVKSVGIPAEIGSSSVV